MAPVLMLTADSTADSGATSRPGLRAMVSWWLRTAAGLTHIPPQMLLPDVAPPALPPVLAAAAPPAQQQAAAGEAPVVVVAQEVADAQGVQSPVYPKP